MRRHLRRAVVLSAVLLALGVPAFASSRQALACSNPNCTLTVTGGSVQIPVTSPTPAPTPAPTTSVSAQTGFKLPVLAPAAPAAGAPVVGAQAGFKLPVIPAATPTAAPTSVSSGSTSTAVTSTVTTGSSFETFISPITATLAAVTFTELPTMAELPPSATVTLTWTVSFTVFDLRGNNQGWVAYLACQNAASGAPCMTSSLAPSNNGAQIAASQFAVAGLASVQTIPLFGDVFSPGIAIDSTGKTLDTPQPVAGACPVEGIGQAIYKVSVPIKVTLTGLQLHYLTLPVSWTSSIAVTIIEAPAPGGVPSSGCPK